MRPLRLSNPRTNVKRSGSAITVKKEEPKSAVVIPTNPILRQPKGTKPPTSYLGKENNEPGVKDITNVLLQASKTKEQYLADESTVETNILQNDLSPDIEKTGTYINVVKNIWDFPRDYPTPKIPF